MEPAEQVEEVALDDRREAGTLLGGVEDGATQQILVPAVDRCRADIEVAAQNRRTVLPVQSPQVRRERLQPRDLPREVRVTDVLAFGAVDGRKRQAFRVGTDQPGAGFLLSGQSLLRDGDGAPAQDRHTVPRLLAVDDSPISLGLEERVGELFLGELEFLEPDQVWAALAQPEHQELEAGPQAVDVPRRDAHPSSPPPHVTRLRADASASPSRSVERSPPVWGTSWRIGIMGAACRWSR